MPCYVDQPISPFGRMMMCHLWADSEAELLAMVDAVGVDRKWIQGHPTLSFGKHRNASWVHFDIAKGKRALALQAGAIETDRYGASYWDAQRKGLTARIETIEAVRRRDGRPADGILTPRGPETDPHERLPSGPHEPVHPSADPFVCGVLATFPGAEIVDVRDAPSAPREA